MKKKILAIITTLLAMTALISLSIITAMAAQPSIVLGSGQVLFRSLDGAKSPSVGSLTSVGSGDGSYTDTTIDSSRSFVVYETSASTVTGGTLRFNYSGASSGSGEYLSVLITDKTDKVLYYGKLKSISSASDSSGYVAMTLPSISVSTPYTLLFFSEKCTSAGDTASRFSSVSLLVYPDPYIITTALSETTQGVNYSFQLKADSKAATHKWSISTGRLPNGLTLDADTGLIYGAPTVSGTFNFTVKLEANGQSNTKALTLKVNPPLKIEFSTNLAESSVTRLSIPTGRTVLLTATVSSGTPEYSNYQWSVNGVVIPGATSASYKVPTSQMGNYRYTFTVADSATANATASIDIEIRTPVNPKLSHATLQFDKAFPAAVSLTKNDGDYTFTGKIKCGSRTLTLGTDFTISGNKVTFPVDTLKSLALGEYTVTLDYDDTTADPSFTLYIIDTSLPPEVGPLATPAAIDRGSALSLTAPTVKTYGTAITSQGWKIKPVGAADFVSFDPSKLLDCSYNGASLVYYATNRAGTTTSNAVTITVKHVPSARWKTNATQHWHICACGEQFDIENHTCNAAGDCTVCGYHCTHVYSEYKSNNDASCTADGTKTRTCSLCGYKDTVTEAGTKLGHSWSAWQVSDTEHWHVCTRCGTKADTAAHVPGIPATYETPQVCTVCGKVLAERLSHDTSSGGSSDTTTPGGDTTKDPSGTTKDPSGETTRDPSGTTSPSDTTPGGGTTSPSDTSSPSGSGTVSPADTSTPGGTTHDTGKVINISRKDGDTDDENPSFVSDTPLGDVTLITIDGRPLTRDEYTLSSDGLELELRPSIPIGPGKHTLVVETPNGRGETTFTISDGESGSRFPFWTLWVIPHVFVDIAGLICIALLAIKRDDDDGDKKNNK